MIPYGRQDIRQEDIDAVIAVLKSEFLTQGPQIPKFEEAICNSTHAKYALAVNSATSALHIACLALGLGEGDILWTSPITFVASSNVGLLCGADVDFVDVDAETFNMDPVKLAKKLAEAKSLNRLPKILIPVHMCGQSSDMVEIKRLADQYDVRVIEDASHAIGGSFEGQPVGDCRYSDVCVFSFHPVKIITTAEGGVATTNNPDLAAKMDLFRSHGVTRNPDLMRGSSDGQWYYQQVELGLNYRMTEIQAALGVSQINRLSEYVDRRNILAERYDRLLENTKAIKPGRAANARSSFHLYPVRVSAGKRKAVFDSLRDSGIGVNVHYIPVHLQPYYQDLGFRAGQFPVAEDYYSRALSLPLYQNLTKEDQDAVVAALKKALT